MLIEAAWRALVDAGVDAVPIDFRHVELRHGGHSERLLVRVASRPLHPRDVAALIDRHDERGLLIVPSASQQVRHIVEAAGWSWLAVRADGGYGVLHLDDVIALGEPDAGIRRPERRRRGRVPWGSLTLIRRLLERPAATQKALAALAHVSQPRVSQTLSELADQHLVARRDTGWEVDDFDKLLDRWLEVYPGPGGITTYWFGLGSPLDQANAVIRHLAEAGQRSPIGSTGSPAFVVSGDVAADFMAPWRTPTRAVIYARTGVDLTDTGLMPAGSDEATVELIVPEDPGVWPTADVSGPVPIADPIQVLWDVRRAPGADSAEAADRLRQILGERRTASCPAGAA